MKKRDIYMKQLLSFKDKPFIKVITGMRRCGKSTLLDLLEEHLLQDGVPKEAIIHINFESVKYDGITDYKDLYVYLEKKLFKSGKTYIMLDEIQQVKAWEKAVNSLTVDYDTDIYITGSNAYLLSSELSTLLSGRYVEIKMLPLSFKEYLDFNEFDLSMSMEDKFNLYLKFGSLPAISQLNNDEATTDTVLSGIYNTVIMKDVVQRNSIKDVSMLEKVVKYLASNIGSSVSSKKISDYITSNDRKTASETVDNFLTMLENAFIFYKAKRYDIKGKQNLQTLGKYYIVDTGIRNTILGYRDGDYGHILENIVYFELVRRNYEVSIGKVGNTEVDFIATGKDDIKYYQVAQSLASKETQDRELASLKAIRDNYEKTILSMDRTFIKSNEGIKYKNIIDFLLSEE